MPRFTLSISFVAATLLSSIGVALADDTDVTAGLSPEVMARIAELQSYGDRFELAIQQIVAEAARPAWQFEAAVPDTDMAACSTVACLN